MANNQKRFVRSNEPSGNKTQTDTVKRLRTIWEKSKQSWNEGEKTNIRQNPEWRSEWNRQEQEATKQRKKKPTNY